MRVGAVVLNYRYWPQINRTLDALAGSRYPLDHVVVVDNASGDGSVPGLAGRPDIQLVQAEQNRGYAAGMNLGVRALSPKRPDAVLLLTHEAALDPAGLGAMVSHLAAHPQAGAVGPLLAWQNKADTVYSAGVRIDSRTWAQHHIGAGEPVAAWLSRPPHVVDSLDGAIVLLRWGAVEATGAINEDYFMYYEEVDYFVRMRRAGWTVACVPSALASQEPGRHPQALWVRNSLKLLADNAPRRVLVREFARNGYHAGREMLHGQHDSARERLVGMAAFLARRPPTSLVGRT